MPDTPPLHLVDTDTNDTPTGRNAELAALLADAPEVSERVARMIRWQITHDAFIAMTDKCIVTMHCAGSSVRPRLEHLFLAA